METTILRDIPFLDNPLSVVDSSKKNRIFVNISDNPQRWKRDLILGEKLFADTFICPVTHAVQTITSDIADVKDILTKRSAYPDIKETPEKVEISKTWILAKKVHEGPNALEFLQPTENAMKKSLLSCVESSIAEAEADAEADADRTIQCLKIEVQGGLERQFVYRFLDDGFRPSIVIVRWSYDIDDHYSTAICVGHLLNCGYTHVRMEQNYSLYMYEDQPLYDICSLKTVGKGNPIMETLINLPRVFADADADADAVKEKEMVKKDPA